MKTRDFGFRISRVLAAEMKYCVRDGFDKDLNMKRIFLAAAIVLMGCAPSWAHDFKLGDLVVEHPWARPSLGASPNGVAYLIVTNNGAETDRLIDVSGDVAGRVELHATLMEGDVMRMRPVKDGVEILPGQSVEIVPGGLHIMLMGLTEPLKEGDSFPLSLRFEHAGSVDVFVHVENKPEKTAPPMREHHHE